MRVVLYHRKHKYRRIVIVISAVLLFGSGFVMKRLENAFYTQIRSYANNLVSDNVEKAVNQIFEEIGEFSYIKEDDEGRVSSISVDAMNINKIKSLAAERAQSELEKMKSHYIYVPLMSIADFPILNAMGIRIPIKILPVTFMDAEYEESFISSGINQTRQKIDLIIKVDVCYSGFMLDETEKLDIRIPIVNNVINGDVPQYYGCLSGAYTPVE